MAEGSAAEDAEHRSEAGSIQSKAADKLGLTTLKTISEEASTSWHQVPMACCRRSSPATNAGSTWTINWPLPIVAPVACIASGIKAAKARSRRESAPVCCATRQMSYGNAGTMVRAHSDRAALTGSQPRKGQSMA